MNDTILVGLPGFSQRISKLATMLSLEVLSQSLLQLRIGELNTWMPTEPVENELVLGHDFLSARAKLTHFSKLRGRMSRRESTLMPK
jgi:hypothetical protein